MALPARGRSILGNWAAQILCQNLPRHGASHVSLRKPQKTLIHIVGNWGTQILCQNLLWHGASHISFPQPQNPYPISWATGLRKSSGRNRPGMALPIPYAGIDAYARALEADEVPIMQSGMCHVMDAATYLRYMVWATSVACTASCESLCYERRDVVMLGSEAPGDTGLFSYAGMCMRVCCMPP